VSAPQCTSTPPGRRLQAPPRARHHSLNSSVACKPTHALRRFACMLASEKMRVCCGGRPRTPKAIRSCCRNTSIRSCMTYRDARLAAHTARGPLFSRDPKHAWPRPPHHSVHMVPIGSMACPPSRDLAPLPNASQMPPTRPGLQLCASLASSSPRFLAHQKPPSDESAAPGINPTDPGQVPAVRARKTRA
jgi:hypothetical protein